MGCRPNPGRGLCPLEYNGLKNACGWEAPARSMVAPTSRAGAQGGVTQPIFTTVPIAKVNRWPLAAA